MLRAGALPPKKRSLEPNPLEKGVLLLQSVAGHGSCGWHGLSKSARALSRFYGKMVRGPGGRTACFCPSTEGLQIRSGDGPRRADSGGCRARERGGTVRLEPSSEGSPGGANGERRGWGGGEAQPEGPWMYLRLQETREPTQGPQGLPRRMPPCLQPVHTLS